MSLNPRITDWKGRVVWLVGASTGIGRATASLLHSRGARVIVSARTASALDGFVRANPGSEAVALDVTDRQSLAEAAAEVVARHGRIDLVVYSAGVFKPMRATAFDLDEALRQLNINYVGALNLLAAVLPQLLQQAAAGQPGHLSLVSSVTGYRGLPTALGYGPTKAALINLAQTLYLDLSDKGVGVSLINPGFVETPLTAQNTFTMPALISPAQAAEQILKGWARGAFEIHFPKRFTLWLKALELLPASAYFPLVRKFTGA